MSFQIICVISACTGAHARTFATVRVGDCIVYCSTLDIQWVLEVMGHADAHTERKERVHRAHARQGRGRGTPVETVGRGTHVEGLAQPTYATLSNDRRFIAYSHGTARR